MVYFYRGKKKNEVPAHLYYVADNAYACMLRGFKKIQKKKSKSKINSF